MCVCVCVCLCVYVSRFIINRFVYSLTPSGPEDVGRLGTNFKSGRTSDPVDVRKTVERAALSEPLRSSVIRALNGNPLGWSLQLFKPSHRSSGVARQGFAT